MFKNVLVFQYCNPIEPTHAQPCLQHCVVDMIDVLRIVDYAGFQKPFSWRAEI